MNQVTQYPAIMNNAREDLGALVAGRFSPEDWQAILERAHAQYLANLGHERTFEAEKRAWESVILDFNRKRSWGFQANYHPHRTREKRKGLGVRFIALTFFAFTFIKIALVWTGQIYTRSQEPKDEYIFFGVIAMVVIGFAYFLWHNRNYED